MTSHIQAQSQHNGTTAKTTVNRKIAATEAVVYLVKSASTSSIFIQASFHTKARVKMGVHQCRVFIMYFIMVLLVAGQFNVKQTTCRSARLM